MIRYYAVRELHTDKAQTWKVLTRGMASKTDCLQWLAFEKSQQLRPNRWQWFVVMKEEQEV